MVLFMRITFFLFGSHFDGFVVFGRGFADVEEFYQQCDPG